MFKNLTGVHKPDILDCISNLSSDEVFTPPEMVNRVLDLLPANVWSNPNLRWLDPATKSGVFLREAAGRLMSGLSQVIPDEETRREHIFKKMLFGLSITELTGYIARRSLYYSKNAASDFSVVRFDKEHGNILYFKGLHHYVNRKCFHCGSPEGVLDRGDHLENYAYSFIHDNTKTLGKKYALSAFGDSMKFDVIIGNPPYQLQDAGDSTGASPIYQLFVEQAKKLNPRYLSMIIPSRWFAGGKGLDEFRTNMLNDKRISHLVDYLDAGDCFPGVEVKGGICYFLWDSQHKGLCEITTVMSGNRLPSAKRDLGEYDVFVRFNEAVSILRKVKAKGDPVFSSKVSTQKPFGFRTNFTNFRPDAFPGSVEIFANKEVGYVDDALITQNRAWLNKYKVLISMAYGAGEGFPHQIIGRPIVAGIPSCCTETYLVCGTFNTKKEALNMEAYLKTKFVRFLISLRKNTQHVTRDRFLFVPDIGSQSKWDDATLYKRFKLTSTEIAFIESIIKEMP